MDIFEKLQHMWMVFDSSGQEVEVVSETKGSTVQLAFQNDLNSENGSLQIRILAKYNSRKSQHEYT